MMIVKLSILLMYLRLFMPNRQSKINRFTQLIVWFNILFFLSNAIVAITGCIPRHKSWQRRVPGKCVNQQAGLIVSAAINVILDICMFLLPIECIWGLQLSTKKKLAISAVFATGSM